MSHQNHNKKLEGNIPYWLFFPIYNSQPLGQKWTEEKQKIAELILKSLSNFLEQHDIKNPIITKPNDQDNCGIYSKCSCPDCCNVKMTNL